MKTEPAAYRPNPIGVLSPAVALVLLLLLLPRPLTYLGLPFFVNFLHFFFVFALYLIVLVFPVRSYDQFFPRLALLFVVICMSAILNGAGVINIFLDFLLLSEPFMILALMTRLSWSPSQTYKLTRLVFYLMLLHLVFAYVQFLFLGADSDDVKGLFVAMGAGHHVGGAVALSAALFFFASFPPQAVFKRLVLPGLLATIVVLADAKQVILVFGISLGIIAILGMESLVVLRATKAFQSFKFTIFPAALMLVIFPFAVSPDVVERFISNMLDGFEHKISVFSILWSFNDSGLNALFGFGPGHTIGRLAYLMPKYWHILVGLGPTRTPITNAIVFAEYAHWITGTYTGSSLYSLRFSWAGIWGDLGVAGVLSYMALWVLVWKRFCGDLLSKFFVCNILVFGLVFSWLEEPGYMGLVAILIGLRWQTMRGRQAEEYGLSTRRYAPANPASPDRSRPA